MIKNTKPSLFDKIVIRLMRQPVWAGTYDRSDFNLSKEIPPNPVYHSNCPTHGYFKGAVTSIIVNSRHVFGVKCKCGFFNPLKFRGREWLNPEIMDVEK